MKVEIPVDILVEKEVEGVWCLYGEEGVGVCFIVREDSSTDIFTMHNRMSGWRLSFTEKRTCPKGYAREYYKQLKRKGYVESNDRPLYWNEQVKEGVNDG
jgi:hypothetical protein